MSDSELLTMAKRFIEAVVKMDEECEENEDFTRVTSFIRGMYHSVSPDTFDRFFGLIADANDPDSRSPK